MIAAMRPILWFIVLFVLPTLLSIGFMVSARAEHWSRARWDATGMAPSPDTHPDAVVQVYAARTWGWKGAFAVHSWIVFKREGASSYERYEVVGWGVGQGAPSVRRNLRPPDGRWAGNDPALLVDVRGAAAEALIPNIVAAIDALPLRHGLCHLARPQLEHFRRLDRPRGAGLAPDPAARPPSARIFWAVSWPRSRPAVPGVQISLGGLLGIAVGIEEGLEMNLLGLVIGIDPKRLAIKLPGLGQLGMG